MSKFKGWEGKPQYRWKVSISINGKPTVFRMTCDELGCPRTAEGSVKAWKAWVEKKKAEIKYGSLEPERFEVLQKLKERIELAPAEEKPFLVSLTDEARKLPVDELGRSFAEFKMKTLVSQGLELPDIDQNTMHLMFSDEAVLSERRRVAALSRKVETKTIGQAVEAFKDELKPTMKLRTFKDILDLMTDLTKAKILDEEMPSNSINELTLSQINTFLRKRNYESHHSHNKRMLIARRFVKWCWTNRFIDEMPRNIADRMHWAEPVYNGEPERFDPKDVKSVIMSLKLPYRLMVLICLNTGCTNADLHSLRFEQIRNDYLTRRRAKTGDDPKSPTVKYKLFPETIAALEEFGWKEEGLIFVNKHGKAMQTVKENENGNISITDNFAQHWRKYANCPILLSKFRSIGATALSDSPIHKGFVDTFLARTLKGVNAIHYTPTEWTQFDNAVMHIRETILA